MSKQTIQEFGSLQTISKQLKDRLLDENIFELLIKEKVIKDAMAQGYSPVSKIEFDWSQPYTYIENEENETVRITCDSTDEKALFDLRCRMKVVKNEH